MKTKWPFLLIIAGIIILLYPSMSEWYADQQQERLLNQAEQSQIVHSHPIANNYAHLNTLLDEGDTADTVPVTNVQQGETVGIITIPAIDVKLPIVEGATKENMRSAAVHVSETGLPGEVGNFAVAAHRAHKYGRLFNRLNELKTNDTINVEVNGQLYTYTIDKIHIVEPTEVSVLNSNGKDQEITLITCDPLINPTHRLIVHGHLTNS